MGKWTYGEEGTAFPVKENEVWQVGEHVFVCSDLMESTLFDSWVGLGIDLLYCDPPWGTSLLNGFRSKAGKPKATHTWQELYRRIADLGHSRGVPVWIEGSKIASRDGKQIPAAIDATGKVERYWEVCYYRKNPSGLYYCGTGEPPASLDLTGMDDDDTPGAVMRAYAGTGVVVDPCAGRGQTSREAQRSGWRSVNNEMHPARVSAALCRMSALVDTEPRRIH